MATKVKLIADGVITPDQITLTTASTGTNTTAPATTAFVQQEISALVDSSPDALNTLNELAAALGDDANFSTTVTNSIATKLPLAGGTLTGDLNFGDSDKAVFGAGSDLQIYHDGSNSIIKDAGTGILQIRASTNLQLQDADGYLYVNCIDGGNGGTTKLYNLNQEKLATTSTGIDVTGTVTADGLTVDTSSAVIQSATGTASPTPTTFNISTTSSASNWTTTSPWGRLAFYSGDGSGGGGKPHVVLDATASNAIGASSSFSVLTTSESANTLTKRLNITNNGDISFYEDTGSTAKFFWDASAESLGIGLTNPSAALETFGGTSFVGAKFKGYSGGKTALVGGDLNTVWFGDDDGSIGTTNNFNIRGAANTARIVTNSETRMTVDGSGNVGIGTTNPLTKFVVSNSGAEGVEFIPGAGGNINYTQHYNRSNSNWVDNRQYANTHSFHSGATEIARITGTGITFNGDTAAANALDDYEEGTWTPAISGATHTVQQGFYTKVGDLVFFKLRIAWSAYNNAAGGVLTGLPFTADAAVESMGVNVYVNSGFGSIPSGKGYLNAYVASNNTNLHFTWQPNTAVAEFASSGNIYVAGTYLT